MYKILLFAGTSEGRDLALYLERQNFPAIVCVATEYGEALIEERGTIHKVLAKRLDAEGMCALMTQENIELVIDATHPYAAVVTENIRQAAAKAQCDYVRLLRASSSQEEEPYVTVESVDAAINYLQDKEGIIFAATGSKELHKYAKLENYLDRVCARILSTKESMEIASALGFAGKNLICMQGPFSAEINVAMMRSVGAKYLVTKESGKVGGFPEKVQAAKDAGAKLIVVGRPYQEEGLGMEEVKRRICTQFGLHPARRIALVGIGMGTKAGLTLEAWDTIQQADLLIGAKRMLEVAGDTDQEKCVEYMPEKIRACIDAHPEAEHIAILLSGDTGFYSGAKKLEEVLTGEEVRRISGISSVVYLCGKLHTSWEDAYLVSVHGRSQNIVAAVREHQKVFALVGKQEQCHAVLRELMAAGYGDVRLGIGCRLSYPDEKILQGTVESLLDIEMGDLSALLLENDTAFDKVTHGIPDEAFQRAKVPMTKEEIRSISLSKLNLGRDSIIYDVGAGTGSLSIEMALRSTKGQVYAIEKKPEAVELIRENAAKFGVTNLDVVEGFAPEALEDLPAPTHAFIGGSSGNLQQIVALLLEKNPQIRIVVNAIALETVHEAMTCIEKLPLTDVDIACVQVAKAKKIAAYHMMMGQNPVYVIAFTGEMQGADHEIK